LRHDFSDPREAQRRQDRQRVLTDLAADRGTQVRCCGRHLSADQPVHIAIAQRLEISPGDPTGKRAGSACTPPGYERWVNRFFAARAVGTGGLGIDDLGPGGGNH
jgi:hypothetical protein